MHNLDTDKSKQLAWQCRRGMLEIDLLLKKYLSNRYEQADEIEKNIFESILTENDQQLFLWLTGREDPPERYQAMVEELRR